MEDPTPTPTPSAAETFTVSGGIGANEDFSVPDGDGCATFAPTLADVEEGDQVTIHDGTGSVVATTELEAPEMIGEECVWLFTAEVPAGKDFYQARRGGWSTDVVEEEALAGGEMLVFTNPP